MKKRILSILLAAALLFGAFPVSGFAAQDAPYQISLEASPNREEWNVGDTVTVRVTVSGSDSSVTAYSAYDLKLHYDETLLRYESGTAADQNAVITETNGQIRVKGYGDDKMLDTVIVRFEFVIVAAGDAEIVLKEAKIDRSDNAGLQNAPLAQIPEEPLVIHADMYYTVTLLGLGLHADSRVASPKEDFSFRVEEPELYDYDLTVTVDDKDITGELIADSKTGTYTIPKAYITGNIVIQATRTLKIPEPTDPQPTDPEPTDPRPTDPEPTDPRPTDPEPTDPQPTDPEPTEPQPTDPEPTNPQPTDPEPTDPRPTDPEPTETQPTEQQPDYVSVVFSGSGAEDAYGDRRVVRGTRYTFRVNRVKGYSYSISSYVNGTYVSCEYDWQQGCYCIPADKVTGDITIHISKTSMVEVKEYLTLQGNVMYLILYRGPVGSHQVPKYDGYRMYWSDLYKTYAWLVSSGGNVEDVWQTAVEHITLADGTDVEEIRYSGNVNMSLHADVGDVSLIREMYEAKYTLDNLEMLQFLNADINGDGKLDIRDAAAVVSIILKEEEERA